MFTCDYLDHVGHLATWDHCNYLGVLSGTVLFQQETCAAVGAYKKRGFSLSM